MRNTFKQSKSFLNSKVFPQWLFLIRWKYPVQIKTIVCFEGNYNGNIKIYKILSCFSGSPLVPRRRGNNSTTATPLNTHLHNKLGRRRSLSLDDLGLKTTGSANNYHTLNSTSHKEVEQTPDESFSNLCDTDDDLDELSSMLEENPPDLLNLDAGNSSSGGELEITRYGKYLVSQI